MASTPFKPQIVRLVGQKEVDVAIAKLLHVPLNDDEPLEMVLRPVSKQRGLDQNAKMWVGPLKDIEEQAWVNRRQYSAEVWHEHFKAEYLPEIDDPDLDTLVKHPETYRKWDTNPKGERVLVGSTTDLTKRGFALYLQQVEAFGASLGVLFTASPRQYMEAA